MLYIIKARADVVANSTLTVGSGLTAFLNNIGVDTPFNPLTGSIRIEMPAIVSSQTIQGGKTFGIDSYGRVTGLQDTVAGTITTANSPNNNAIVNYTSPIAFLRVPVKIYNNTYTTSDSSVSVTISAYPKITSFTSDGTVAAVVPNANIPSTAKNLIVDCDILKSGPDGGNADRFVVAASNIGLLSPTATASVGDNEYIIASSRAAGGGDNIRSASQAFIPLSATSSGDLTCAFRISPSNRDGIVLRIVGYTL
jgi:hypothetical protein